MSKTRNNHYVPEWYQRGFLSASSSKLHFLDLNPDKKLIPSGEVVFMNEYHLWPRSKCFRQRDLYTTFLGPYISDEIERKLFGGIDDMGSRAVRAFIQGDPADCHHNFSNFFQYIDAQKIRTPKGLNWITTHYKNLEQNQLMYEMQAIRNMHCTIWTEGVREIVSAEESDRKFILSDHPVTIYNYAFSPAHEQCAYPNDPSIALKGTQTIFTLDKEHCLILTNYEYANNPDTEKPTEKRAHAKHFRSSLVRTDAFIRSRRLSEEDVVKINLIIKSRARRYIAASDKDGLYPEKHVTQDWSELREVLLPPSRELWQYGGETYVGYEDGGTYYQDAFGRTMPENKHLKKPKRQKEPGPNEPCGCGSGKKYKKCCRNKSESERPTWEVLSIRERNLIFYNGINDILGLTKGKTWDDVRRDLSNEQVKRIHELYGSLWPIESDIFSLLPKPDKCLRALYTGIIDPRVISGIALNSALYLDEIIILHPFVNPYSVKEEFSPVHVPHQHKQQTLKNIIVLFTLMPFIEEGFIHFIPDPCVFDAHLRNQMFSMANERSKQREIDNKDYELMERLAKDDFERTILMLSKDQQESQIKQAIPDILEKQLEKLLEHIEIKKREDPLALLQDGVFSEEGGQLTMMSMSPNFEISLFLAQVTGALIVTDSHYRWNELTDSQNKEGVEVGYNWGDLTNCINNFEYIMCAKPDTVIYLRMSGILGKLRKTLREIYSSIQNEIEPEERKAEVERLKQLFTQAYESSQKETEGLLDQCIKTKIECAIPVGGFVDNNVQRMLLTSGSDNHLNSVPMAMFMEIA